MTKENVFLGALTGLGAYFLGLPYELLYCWLMLMVIDIITGVISACLQGSFSSREMKFGLFRKVFDIAVMIALLVIQRVAELNGITVPFGSITVGAFCFKELGSVLENYVKAGGKVPNVVSNWLSVIGSKLNKDPDKKEGENNEQN